MTKTARPARQGRDCKAASLQQRTLTADPEQQEDKAARQKAQAGRSHTAPQEKAQQRRAARETEASSPEPEERRQIIVPTPRLLYSESVKVGGGGRGTKTRTH